MKKYKSLRIILCIYESLRLVFLAWVCVFMHHESPNTFPWAAMIIPGTLFFLIVLFLGIDTERYSVYCPLYISGKILGIISTVFWIFLSKIIIISESLSGETTFIMTLGILIFMVFGEFFSARAAFVIMKGTRR